MIPDFFIRKFVKEIKSNQMVSFPVETIETSNINDDTQLVFLLTVLTIGSLSLNSLTKRRRKYFLE